MPGYSIPQETGAAGLAAHLADAVDAHAASAVSFAPVGSVAATDAQAAIAEVATDAAADLAAHTGDASAAHAASAVSFAPVGSIAATDAQAAIAEVATDAAADLTAHTGDASAAHAASAISFTPTGSVAATDVQAAIAEVAAEATAARVVFRATGAASTVTDTSSDLLVLVGQVPHALTLRAITDGKMVIVTETTGNGGLAGNEVTITPNGAETIEGQANYVIATSRGSVTLLGDATAGAWRVVT